MQLDIERLKAIWEDCRTQCEIDGADTAMVEVSALDVVHMISEIYESRKASGTIVE